jgi:acyl-CoA thioesterase-1
MHAFPSVSGLVTAAALLGAVVGCGPNSSTPTSPAAPAAEAPIVVALGDSLTAGPGLGRDETFPADLQHRAAAAGYPHRIINAGVTGDTSTDIARRFDRDVVAGTRVLILEAGANDGLQGVPVATLRQNLTSMIERAQSRNIRVLLCGMETPPTHGFQYTIDFHRIFPDLASTYDVPLMPFLLMGIVGLPEYNLGDRVHPNARGAQLIADNMWPYLEPLLRETMSITVSDVQGIAPAAASERRGPQRGSRVGVACRREVPRSGMASAQRGWGVNGAPPERS